MKITYFINKYPAVSHTFIRREILQLEKQGHEVQRISLRSPNELVDNVDRDEQKKTVMLLEQSFWSIFYTIAFRLLRHPILAISQIGILFHLWKLGNKTMKLASYFAEALVLAESCNRNESQHLRVHFGTNGALVARLCHRLGGPGYSVAYHGPDEFDHPTKWDIGGVVSESEFVSAITSYCSAQIMRWTGRGSWKKIHIVRCAIDHAFLVPEPLPSSSPRYLCIIARLSAQKGLPLLLEGFSQAIKEGANIGLHIVGDGEMRAEIESRVKELNLSNSVIIHGSLSGEGVRSVILESCGLVLPSFAEGLPVVLMEAMGLGRPVIVSSIAGIPELVHHGDNGWLIPSGSVSDLVESIHDFARLPLERLTEMGLRGHREVKSRHSIENEVEVLEKLIVDYSAGA